MKIAIAMVQSVWRRLQPDMRFGRDRRHGIRGREHAGVVYLMAVLLLSEIFGVKTRRAVAVAAVQRRRVQLTAAEHGYRRGSVGVCENKQQ